MAISQCQHFNFIDKIKTSAPHCIYYFIPQTDFVWKIRYREGPEEKYEVDAGKNRLWTITCSATSQTNKITATISVT